MESIVDRSDCVENVDEVSLYPEVIAPTSDVSLKVRSKARAQPVKRRRSSQNSNLSTRSNPKRIRILSNEDFCGVNGEQGVEVSLPIQVNENNDISQSSEATVPVRPYGNDESPDDEEPSQSISPEVIVPMPTPPNRPHLRRSRCVFAQTGKPPSTDSPVQSLHVGVIESRVIADDNSLTDLLWMSPQEDGVEVIYYGSSSEEGEGDRSCDLPNRGAKRGSARRHLDFSLSIYDDRVPDFMDPED